MAPAQGSDLLSLLLGICDGRSIPSMPGSYSEVLLDGLEKNKVVLLAADMNPSSHAVFGSQFVDRVKELSARHAGQEAAFRIVSDAAKHCGLNLLVIKTLKPFRYVGSDIDLLAQRPAERDAVVGRLKELGCIVLADHHGESTLVHRAGRQEYLLDVHSRITAGHIAYVNTETLWNGAQRLEEHEGLFRPSATSEAYLLALHCMYKDGVVNLADFYAFQGLLPAVDLSKLMEWARVERTERALAAFASGVASLVARSERAGHPHIYELTKLWKTPRAYRVGRDLPHTYPARVILSLHLHRLRALAWGGRPEALTLLWQITRTCFNPRAISRFLPWSRTG